MTPRLGSRGDVVAVAALVVLLMGLVLVAVHRELQLPTGPGQVWMVPGVAAAYLLAGLAVPRPRLERVLLVLVAASWLAGSLATSLLVLHQGVLLVALVVVAHGGVRGVGWVAVIASGPVALGVLVQPAVALLFAAAAVVAVVGGRARSARGGAALGSLAVAAGITAAWVGAQSGGLVSDPQVGLVLYEGGLLVAAGAVGWAARPTLGAALTDSALADPRATGLVGLGIVLAEALRDPALHVVPAEGDEGDPSQTSGMARTPVDDGAAVIIAVIHHTDGVLDDARTRLGVQAAVRLVVQAVRRQHALEEGLDLLLAARRRVDSAADRRRTANARALRGQVVLPLQGVLSTLRSVADDPEAQGARQDIALAAQQVALAIADVDRLVWKASPMQLGDGRLGAALAELCARSAVEAQLTVAAGVAGDPAVETTLFYVCSEALANVHKHSGASSVTVELAAEDGGLVLEVADDGCGGAREAGSGLLGLADRLAAVGGRLSVDSPVGEGTTLLARVPLLADLRPGADVQVAGGRLPLASEAKLISVEPPD